MPGFKVVFEGGPERRRKMKSRLRFFLKNSEDIYLHSISNILFLFKITDDKL
jgi:hypothetical protein